MAPEAYVRSLSGGLNALINSPGRQFFNPIEMSYQAPFVDAARSVDPVNRENTFISYYTYGSVLGLALDLELRALDRGLDLDGYMRLLWDRYGKTEIPYSIRDLESTLADYAGADLAGRYFDQHIYKSEAPDFESLFNSVGVSFGIASSDKATLGTGIQISDGVGRLRSNALKGSAVYEAGINVNDEIMRIDGKSLDGMTSADALISSRKPGDRIEVVVRRWGQERVVQLTLGADQSVQTMIEDQADAAATARRAAWLR
jgi:predicted metalloprotease with PDZ domain